MTASTTLTNEAPAWRLATRRSGSRDGELMLVDETGTAWVSAAAIAPTLQALLDDWDRLAPAMEALRRACAANHWAGAERFDPGACMAPLPRAYQWADASVYLNHARLMYQWRKEPIPTRYDIDPLVYQGGSDVMLGCQDPIEAVDEALGIDLEAEVAVITGDVPMGVSAQAALSHVRLVVLLNDVSLRGLIPDEVGRGFGFYQSKPATSFAPVAVTPAVLGEAWRDGKVDLQVDVAVNRAWFGTLRSGEEMVFGFGQIIAHLARTRRLAAGTVVGAGTISNADPARGNACITESRVRGLLAGQVEADLTPYLRHGDRVRIEAVDVDGRSVFGAIDQAVVVAGVR